jgi:pSer/pThr/pTyr-binding forkhead associated (FHA) protein
VTRGAADSPKYPLGKETTIGRAHTNHIVLKEARISRQHAIIRQAGKEFVIEDLQSSNGVYVNGERLKEHVLTNGDQIQIGDFVMEFHQ